MQPTLHSIHGSIIGTVIGDAIGLPYEGLSARRGGKLLGLPDRYRFLLGRGMMSDDGEHTCIVAKALIDSKLDATHFSRKLAWQFRWWLLGLPAGIGRATLRSLIKLWLGFPPSRSGVFSAGNGPAMRCAVIGVVATELDQLASLVEATTQITHTDPKAYHGALAIALAARTASRGEPPETTLPALRSLLPHDCEVLPLIEAAFESAKRGQSAGDFARSIGSKRGVSGYVLHKVPTAVQVWASHPEDYRQAVMAAVACGGDTDTVAACVGGIVGSRVGVQGIPPEWRNGLLEWPRSVHWIERLAGSLTDAANGLPPRHRVAVGPLILARNILFDLAVLAHGFRRLLPPY